jgi:hypothetical protein
MPLAFFLGTSAAASPARSPHVVSAQGVGGLPLASSYSKGSLYFARSGYGVARKRFTGGGCFLEYPRVGLEIWWGGSPLLTHDASTCLRIEEAIASGVGWHTKNGLAIGDPVTRLRRLFPHVYDTRHAGPKGTPRGSIEWDITVAAGEGEHPALTAMVRAARVVALVVEIVGR